MLRKQKEEKMKPQKPVVALDEPGKPAPPKPAAKPQSAEEEGGAVSRGPRTKWYMGQYGLNEGKGFELVYWLVA